jgi:cellulose synthase operon protein C
VAEALSKKRSSNPGLLNTLGNVKLSAGDKAGARASFEAARKLDPKFALPLLNLARLDLQANLLDAAEARLKELLAADPKSTEVMFEMANLADRRGQPIAVMEWLEKATAGAGQRDTRWGLALTDLHLANGNPRVALKVIKSLATKAPDDFFVLLATARAQMASGDGIGAKASLTNAARVAEFNPDLQVRVAELQLAINNVAGADYSLAKAISGQNNHLPALILRTQVDLRQGNIASAEKRAREWVTKMPKSATGHLQLAQIAATKGQNSEVIAALRRAHAVEPSTNTFLQLFNALAVQKNAAATDLALQWLKLHPTDVLARSRLGIHYEQLNDLPAAKQTFTEALKILPNRAELLNSLANVMILQKDPDAVKIAELAVQNNPLNGLVVDTLGWALLQNGQSDRGLATLRKARDLEPDHPEIHYHLGVALAQAGQKAQAIDELRTALKLSPKFPGSDKATDLLSTLK